MNQFFGDNLIINLTNRTYGRVSRVRYISNYGPDSCPTSLGTCFIQFCEHFAS